MDYRRFIFFVLIYNICDIIKHKKKGVEVNMKKIKFTIFSLLFIIFLSSSVDAASFNLSSNVSSVAPNGKFKISVGGDCIGRVNLSVSNGTLSTSSIWVEQGYVSVEVTAGASGKVTVTATQVTVFSDSDANIYSPVSISVSLNINANNPSSNKPNTSGNTSQKSGDNTLSSLSVDVGEITPKFDKNQTEYNLNLPAGTQKIQIKGDLSNAKSKVTGLGEITLTEGNNKISITVTAENGAKKTYTINVYVDEPPKVFLPYQNQQIGLITNPNEIPKLEGFSSNEFHIDEDNIHLFTKENINIIYGINEEKEKSFYLFNKESKSIEYKITPLNLNHKDFLLSDKEIQRNGLTLDKITINEIDVNCYQWDNQGENYCLFNVLKEDGTVKEYLYEKTEGTMQLYQEFKTCPEINKKNQNLIIYVLSGIIALAIGVILFLVNKIKKGDTNETTTA